MPPSAAAASTPNGTVYASEESGASRTAARVQPAPTIRSTTESRIGSIVAETYRVERLIAEGGMGSVFEVVHLRLGHHYVLKYLDGHLAGGAEARARFRQEAEIAASLDHPAIIQVFDFNTDGGGEPYMVMEFFDGQTLDDFFRGRQVSFRDVMRVFEPLCGALIAAHRAGVVHRDLKPSNVMVKRSESGAYEVRLLDFGISKLHAEKADMTCDNVVMGTPNYMSPEQASGKTSQVDARTDVFALGTLLYEMFSGRKAFEGTNTPALLHALIYDQPKQLDAHRPDLPNRVIEIVHQCLAKSPADRFENVAALRDALIEAARASGRRRARARSTAAAAASPSPRTTSKAGWVAGWVLSLGACAALTATVATQHAAAVAAENPEVVVVPPAPVEAERAPLQGSFEDLSVGPGSRILQLGSVVVRADTRGITSWVDGEGAPRTRPLPSASSVTALAAGEDGTVVVAQADGTVGRWDASLVGDAWHRRVGSKPIDAVALAGDYLAVARGVEVELFNAETGRSLKRFAVGDGLIRLLMTRGSKRRLLVAKPNSILVFDADRRRLLGEVALDGRMIRLELGQRASGETIELTADFEQGSWSVRRRLALHLGRRAGELRLEMLDSVALHQVPVAG